VSVETAARFFEKLFGDQSLLAELAAALRDDDSPGGDIRRVVAVARKHGFEFTPEEALAARADGELNDGELAKVTGGSMNPDSESAAFLRERIRRMREAGLDTSGEMRSLGSARKPG